MQNNMNRLSINAVWMFLKIQFPLRFQSQLKHFQLGMEVVREGGVEKRLFSVEDLWPI